MLKSVKISSSENCMNYSIYIINHHDHIAKWFGGYMRSVGFVAVEADTL